MFVFLIQLVVLFYMALGERFSTLKFLCLLGYYVLIINSKILNGIHFQVKISGAWEYLGDDTVLNCLLVQIPSTHI